MSRILTLIVVFSLLSLAWFGLSQYQKSYEILPATLPKKIEVPLFKDWHEFTPRSEKFHVLLPVLPQHASEVQSDRHYDMYLSEKDDGTIFMISLINFKTPIDPKHHEIVLNSIMEDLLNTNSTNNLKFSNTKTIDNRKTLNFTIENSEIIINGKTFMNEQTLYVLTYISKIENQNKKEIEKFMNSFRLEGKKNLTDGVKSE